MNPMLNLGTISNSDPTSVYQENIACALTAKLIDAQLGYGELLPSPVQVVTSPC